VRFPAAAAANPTSGAPSDPASARRRWLRFVLLLAAVVVVGALAGIVVASAIHVPSLDAYVDLSPRLITRLLDRDGQVFATYARERRQMIEEGALPKLLQNAVLSAEDASFFSHGGVDLVGVVRAFALNFVRGRRAFGASTISMQLARQLMGRREKLWERKIAETLLTIELEKRFSKQQILTLYCNLMFLGHGNYGMEAAARDYFGHGVEELTLTEAATLAGILQRPSDYSPYRRPKAVVARRNYVLRRMFENNYIDRASLDEAVRAPLALAHPEPTAELAPYFAEEVRQSLEREVGTERLYGEGLRVTSTLDARIQRAAESALRDGLVRIDRRRGWRGPIGRGHDLAMSGVEIERTVGRNPAIGEWLPGLVVEAQPRSARVRTPEGEIEIGADAIEWTGRKAIREGLRDGDLAWFRRLDAEKEGDPVRWELEQEPRLEGAVIVLESSTGAVRALVGGWDFQRNKFDRATQARRQVGSAFKPFVFGAAFENGFTPADTIFDAPVVFAGADGLPSYAPRNYYRRYYGVLTLRYALEHSVNVASVKLMQLVGVDRVVDLARRLGIESPLPPYPSLALGSADLLPMELASAYAAIANQGVWVRPYMIQEIRRRDGAVLLQQRVEASKAMEPAVAYVLAHVLEGVVDRGTGASVSGLPVALAGKTGTTNDYTDAWFVGFSPRYTILAWVGHDQKRTIGRRMTGAEAALPIWRRVVEAGLADGWIERDESFPVPGGVELRAVEPKSGLAARPGAPATFEEAFVAGTAPARPWEPRWQSILALPWPQQLAFYTPREGEVMPDEVAISLVEQIAADEAEESAGGQ